jgi:hypothetical protein
MRPNEGWNVDKVEQTFNALLEDGKMMKRRVITEV